MLKALELIGFKSFAEKTQFEFPRGITVVVGPNGSGKSNVVDAIKWVLGEQSVKSLRGKEMADVIFNGSGSRRPLNSAEITLTFDNSSRLLAVDTPEVHITRRVYRSGEGEYLINRQPCRLRDIRDLFSGTGIATEAYSVIEQGKVDVLLQSSPRDRRIIFEEAAGISRFKVKKLEAIRRLERVEQNLLRLSDIVDEVDNRLKSVRMQASKARRYKEYVDRLQELRTQVALADWRTLTQQLTVFEADLLRLGSESAALAAETEKQELESVRLESEIGEADAAVRAHEAQIAENRQRLATTESTLENQRARSRELEEQVAKHRLQLASMSVRAGNLETQLHDVAQAMHAAELRNREISGQVADDERALTELTSQLDNFRSENQQRRATHLELLRAASTLGNEISALRAKLAAAEVVHERAGQRTQELNSAEAAGSAELDGLRREEQELAALADMHAGEVTLAQSALADTRSQLAAQHRDLSQVEPRHIAALERAAVLEELEKRREGLGAGIKEVLSTARDATEGPFIQVRGLLADLVHVNVEMAPLVEVALGEKAQHVVVAQGHQWLEFLMSEPYRFHGRVGFLMLDQPPPPPTVAELESFPGVLNRADRLVETAPEFRGLVESLLRNTWIVDNLQSATQLAQQASGQHFVTLAGECLMADGSVTVGPRHTSIGLISRRSELRALHEQIAELSARLAQLQSEIERLESKSQSQEQQVATLAAEHQQSVEALAEQRSRAAGAEQKLLQIREQLRFIADESRQAELERKSTDAALNSASARLEGLQTQLGETERRIVDTTGRIDELDALRGERQRRATSSKVDFAKSEQQLESLQIQWRRFEQDQQDRLRAILESRQQLSQSLDRSREAERLILAAESELASLYLDKEQLTAQTVELINLREDLRRQRQASSQQALASRSELRKLEESLHKQELAAGGVRHDRQVLADRFREDYAIQLDSLTRGETAADASERHQVDEEIAELRRKITGIGSVNLDALQEAEQLEARFESLSNQFQDLSSAKISLEQIIGKINADSRRLFAQTLEAVKGHFQVLFRKLFGGGQADIVLEEGIDILESGIEIVARPPGKEPRNISLLSGGEKTLTCVALLLAIFRSRPSPFCVLDEVDAALDEANIERFVAVLKDFLTSTQFVVVTHSKKTMTCANTLHGVTMQESGVSKRVSVRFEDVSDNGEIRQPTDSAGDASAAGGETQAA